MQRRIPTAADVRTCMLTAPPAAQAISDSEAAVRDAEAGIAAAEREARETSERRNALQNERRKLWAAGDEADKAAAALKAELQRLEKRARAASAGLPHDQLQRGRCSRLRRLLLGVFALPCGCQNKLPEKLLHCPCHVSTKLSAKH